MTGAYEESVLETIEAYRVLWENTRNPLFVWNAISLCFVISARSVREATGRLPELPLREAYPFPDWCMAYLSIVSSRISALADGKDYRIAPTPYGDAAGGAEAANRWLDAPSHVTPTKATELSLWALGLRRDGSTAFEDFTSLWHKQLDMLSFEELTQLRGKSYGEAIATVADAAGIEPRSMKKRLKFVRDKERSKAAR